MATPIYDEHLREAEEFLAGGLFNSTRLARALAARDERIAELERERDYYKAANEALGKDTWEVTDSIARRAASERIAELERALRDVEDWWLNKEMKNHTGAPFVIFQVREVLRKEVVLDRRAAAALSRTTEGE